MGPRVGAHETSQFMRDPLLPTCDHHQNCQEAPARNTGTFPTLLALHPPTVFHLEVFCCCLFSKGLEGAPGLEPPWQARVVGKRRLDRKKEQLS